MRGIYSPHEGRNVHRVKRGKQAISEKREREGGTIGRERKRKKRVVYIYYIRRETSAPPWCRYEYYRLYHVATAPHFLPPSSLSPPAAIHGRKCEPWRSSCPPLMGRSLCDRLWPECANSFMVGACQHAKDGEAARA